MDIKKLAVNNSTATLTIGKSTTAPAPVDTIVKIDTTEGWDVRAKNIDLSGLNFKMDNENEPVLAYGFDYNHLDIHNLALNLENLLYSTGISGNIRHMAVTDKSGLDLRELRTNFVYNDTGVSLKDLFLQTPNTLLQNYLEFHYPSLAAMEKNMQSLRMNINLEKSVVGLHDVSLFVPDLRKQPLFHKYENGHITLEAKANGSLNNLNIQRLYAWGLEHTEIQLTGRIGGLPDPKKLSYNLHIDRFNSSRDDILALVPPNTLPESFRIPDRFGIMGLVAGNDKDIATDIALTSTDGSAYLKGNVTTSPGTGRERYDLTVKTLQLNLGHILKQDSLLGAVTTTFDVNGQSFDPKTMDAVAAGDITSASIKGYRYHDISFSGKMAAQHGQISIKSADSNLRMAVTATADFSGKYVATVADVRMDSVDLKALKLSSTELRARGVIHADFPELNPDYPRGRFTWYDPVIVASGKRYFMDSVYAISQPSADTGQNIYIGLGVMDAYVSGKTPLTKIGAIVQDHINRHYTSLTDSLKADISKMSRGKKQPGPKSIVSPPPAKDTSIPSDYNLVFLAHVYDKPLLHSLLPGLTSFDSIHIDGSLTPRTLSLNVAAPEIVYNTLTVENAKAHVLGTDSALTYSINVDQVSQSDFALYYADIHGSLDKNIVSTNISLSDATKKERFALKASMQSEGNAQVIQLLPGLKLNYETWDVNQPNKIVFANNGFYVQNFQISNKDQFIKANSDRPQTNTPLKIDISNFRLANLTDIASKNDTLPANGILSGNVTIDEVSPVTKMTGDLQVQGLSVFGDTVGNLHALVNNKTDDELSASITLQGNGNDISLTGLYYLKPNSANMLNFDMAVNALAVSTIEGAAMHQIKNSSGYLRGNLKVQGTLTSPSITGELKTDNLKTSVAGYSSDLKMPDERIEFTGHQVAFNNFTIVDSTGNKATLTGDVDITTLTDHGLNLKISAQDWHAIHTTAKENNQLYGDLVLNASLTVTGTASVPSMDGSIHVLKGTKLTVANPNKDPELQSTKGIVLFVNMRDTSWGKALMPQATDTGKTMRKLAAGSDININIIVDKEAQFTMIIDEASGDFVNVSGDASINTSVTPGGVFNVTGSYTLHQGEYQMNYNFIKRKFIIQDGSTIVFAGDPLKNTMLDVTASYRANTPPYDLVVRQLTDATQMNYYKQNLPFDIEMHMKGNLELPAFTFDVVLPENKVYPLTPDQIELIETKLTQLRQDTSELNKQVFAVLILGRFVSDDPFSSGAGSSASFAAVQSVSNFIGEQLNSAASKLVKGVDLSVDMPTTQDYTTGTMRQRTDLNVAASKRILNDRLKLTVGNDFEVEGPQTNSNNSQSDMLPSNLAADYLLTADGRYTLRVYRTDYNEGPLEGFVTETGVNFIVSVDYDRFKTVFMRSKRRKELEKSNGQ